MLTTYCTGPDIMVEQRQERYRTIWRRLTITSKLIHLRYAVNGSIHLTSPSPLPLLSNQRPDFRRFPKLALPSPHKSMNLPLLQLFPPTLTSTTHSPLCILFPVSQQQPHSPSPSRLTYNNLQQLRHIIEAQKVGRIYTTQHNCVAWYLERTSTVVYSENHISSKGNAIDTAHKNPSFIGRLPHTSTPHTRYALSPLPIVPQRFDDLPLTLHNSNMSSCGAYRSSIMLSICVGHGTRLWRRR